MLQVLESIERSAEALKASGFSRLGKDLMGAANRQRRRGLEPEKQGVVVFDKSLDHSKDKKPLTPNERKLVGALKKRPNEVIGPDELHEEVFGSENSRGSIKKLVSLTRSKVEDDPKKPKFIVTEFGGGYMWKDSRYFNSELIYDPDTFDLNVAGKHLILVERQRNIFRLLVENAGDVVTYKKFGEIGEHERKPIRDSIHSIRRRVRNATQKELKSIVPERGVGYKLVDPGNEASAATSGELFNRASNRVA